MYFKSMFSFLYVSILSLQTAEKCFLSYVIVANERYIVLLIFCF